MIGTLMLTQAEATLLLDALDVFHREQTAAAHLAWREGRSLLRQRALQRLRESTALQARIEKEVLE